MPSVVDEEKKELRALFYARFGAKPEITQAMLHKLIWLTDKAFESHYNLKMHMIPMNHLVAKMIRTKGIMYQGLNLYVGADYFDKREAYTFAKDGSVYFCDWASTPNHRPFLTAFREWITSI